MIIPLFVAFLAAFILVIGFWPAEINTRPKLKLKLDDPLMGLKPLTPQKKTSGPTAVAWSIIKKLAIFNRPLAVSPTGRRMYRDLAMARTGLTVEEFFLIKEILIVVFVLLSLKL